MAFAVRCTRRTTRQTRSSVGGTTCLCRPIAAICRSKFGDSIFSVTYVALLPAIPKNYHFCLFIRLTCSCLIRAAFIPWVSTKVRFFESPERVTCFHPPMHSCYNREKMICPFALITSHKKNTPMPRTTLHHAPTHSFVGKVRTER